jgi:hypothetical protein
MNKQAKKRIPTVEDLASIARFGGHVDDNELAKAIIRDCSGDAHAALIALIRVSAELAAELKVLSGMKARTSRIH